MNTVAKDILDKLKTAGVIDAIGDPSDTSKWGGFDKREPEAPDRAITIYANGGPAPWYTFGFRSQKYTRPTFQVRIRGNRKDSLDAYEKALEVETELDHCPAFTGAGAGVSDSEASYSTILQTSEILPLEIDDNNRHVFVLNFMAFRKSK